MRGKLVSTTKYFLLDRQNNVSFKHQRKYRDTPNNLELEIHKQNDEALWYCFAFECYTERQKKKYPNFVIRNLNVQSSFSMKTSFNNNWLVEGWGNYKYLESQFIEESNFDPFQV